MFQTWQQLKFEDCGWDCLCQWGWNWLCSQQLWPLVPALLPGAASCFHLRQLRKGDSRRHTFISSDQLPVNWSPHIRLETNTPINILFTSNWQIWKGFNDLILLVLVLCFCYISELTKSTSKPWSLRKGCSKYRGDVVWEWTEEKVACENQLSYFHRLCQSLLEQL